MSRSMVKRSLVLMAVVLSGGLLAAACGGGGDELLIARSFFQAARFDDRTSLGNMSLVPFTPQDDGIASSPGVDFVGEEERRPLQMIELNQALAETRDAETNFRADKKMYQDNNEELITLAIESGREGEDPSNADIRRAVQAWTGRTDERVARNNNAGRREHFDGIRNFWNTQVAEERDWARRVSEAQNALNDERRIVDVSLYDFVRDSPEQIDVIQYGGELITKQFTVSATVTQNEVGEERTMCFTIQRADLHDVPMPSAEEEGEMTEGPVEGRWIITEIDKTSNAPCAGHEAAD
ncbi:MAG: hypothetical protein OXG42_03155 [Chloroflexi bacterium]|nr:hypothetical protein [Chloroflexota bacterium]